MARESLRQHHNTGVKLGCGSHCVQSRITVVSWHWGTVNQVFVFMKINKSLLILPCPCGPVCSAGLRSWTMLLTWLPLSAPSPPVPPSPFTASPEHGSAMAGSCLVKAKALAQNFLQHVCVPDLGCHSSWQAHRMYLHCRVLTGPCSSAG